MNYSKIEAVHQLPGAHRNETTELHGRVRVAIIDTVADNTDKEVLLFHAPAGRCRILALSHLACNSSSGTIKVGYKEFVGVDNVPVEADDDALLASTNASSTTGGVCFVAAGLSGALLTSNAGVDIVATVSAIAKGDVITGAIYYVVD